MLVLHSVKVLKRNFIGNKLVKHRQRILQVWFLDLVFFESAGMVPAVTGEFPRCLRAWDPAPGCAPVRILLAGC
jgi:hypothetical protein